MFKVEARRLEKIAALFKLGARQLEKLTQRAGFSTGTLRKFPYSSCPELEQKEVYGLVGGSRPKAADLIAVVSDSN